MTDEGISKRAREIIAAEDGPADAVIRLSEELRALAEAYNHLPKLFQPQIDALKAERDQLRKRVAELEEENHKLRAAICTDGSITDIRELLEFAEDLQDAYRKLADLQREANQSET